MPTSLDGLLDQAHRLLPQFPDAVAGDDGRGPLLHKAPPWLAPLLGVRPDELEGRLLSEIPGALARALAGVTTDVLTRGTPVTDYLVEFRDGAGDDHAVLLRASPLPAEVAGAPDRVGIRVHDVSSTVRSRKELTRLSRFHDLVGADEAMRRVYRKVSVYGPSEAPVVVTGETGTGKELVARALHVVSPRRDKTFVAVNCSAISPELFESELFGHDRGSFTGAGRTHKGRFERASGGTLFLDEVGDMPPQAQTKLLRVLETRELERVGGESPIAVDVRVVAATNIPLERAVAIGRFRADLFHRLSVFRIHVPALREHRDDLPLLVDHFLGMMAEKYDRPRPRLTPDAMDLLADYTWPGNVRELRNVIERVVVENPGGLVTRAAFREWVGERLQLASHGWPPGGDGSAGDAPPQMQTHRELPALPAPSAGADDDAFVIESTAVAAPAASPAPPPEITEEGLRAAFLAEGGNLTRAAAALGVHKATLYRHMKRLGLTRDSLEKP